MHQAATPGRWLQLTIQRAALYGLALALLVALGGCGFQPRGQAPGLSGLPSPLHLAGVASNTALYRELSLQLHTAGVTLLPQAEGAAAVLQLSERGSSSRVLSLDSRNRAVEFVLEESVRFVLRRAGTAPAPAQSVRSERILYQPADAILSSSRETVLLRAEMQRELATQIMRRLAAAN